MNPTSVKLGSRKKALKEIADKKGIKIHTLLLMIIDNFLKRNK